MPDVYKELDGIRLRLEQHFRDMQDIEFTIQEGQSLDAPVQNRQENRSGRPSDGDGHG